MVLKAARRYANALLQVAIEQEMLEKVLDDINSIGETIEASRELKLFLRSPVIKPDEKRNVLHKLFESGCEPLTIQFLDLVVRKGRERQLEQITKGFIKLYKLHEGIQDVELFTAMEMTDEVLDGLVDTLNNKTGMKIDLKVTKRPELIGGVAVKIGDTVIDGTVRYKIDQLESLFKTAAI